MRSLITSSRKRSSQRLPMLNLQQPSKSLLILKPTAKVPQKLPDGSFDKPSSIDPVSHMGGLKMHVDDQSYKAFLAWISDYAKIVGQEYQNSDDLPRDNWYPSKHVLRVKDVPEGWPAMSRVQLFVHGFDEASGQWRDQPIAFTQGLVTPRRMVNGSLFLLKSDGINDDWDSSGVTLPRGRYLIKVFYDSGETLASDPTAFLGSDDYQGSLETHGVWREGFKDAKVVSATEFVLPAGERCG